MDGLKIYLDWLSTTLRRVDASGASLEAFLAANVAPPAAVTTDGWPGYAGLGAAGYAHEPINLARAWGDAVLRLPAIKLVWPDFAARSDKEGWPAARFLAALAEHEMAERARRRIERHLDEARLPPGKTFDSFEFDAVPMISKAQVMALAAGDSWLEKGANLLMFGPPGARQIASWGRARPGAGGERLARAVHAHHRPRPAAPDRPPRPPARGSHRQARQVSPPHPR